MDALLLRRMRNERHLSEPPPAPVAAAAAPPPPPAPEDEPEPQVVRKAKGGGGGGAAASYKELQRRYPSGSGAVKPYEELKHVTVAELEEAYEEAAEEATAAEEAITAMEAHALAQKTFNEHFRKSKGFQPVMLTDASDNAETLHRVKESLKTSRPVDVLQNNPRVTPERFAELIKSRGAFHLLERTTEGIARPQGLAHFEDAARSWRSPRTLEQWQCELRTYTVRYFCDMHVVLGTQTTQVYLLGEGLFVYVVLRDLGATRTAAGVTSTQSQQGVEEEASSSKRSKTSVGVARDETRNRRYVYYTHYYYPSHDFALEAKPVSGGT